MFSGRRSRRRAALRARRLAPALLHHAGDEHGHDGEHHAHTHVLEQRDNLREARKKIASREREKKRCRRRRSLLDPPVPDASARLFLPVAAADGSAARPLPVIVSPAPYNDDGLAPRGDAVPRRPGVAERLWGSGDPCAAPVNADGRERLVRARAGMTSTDGSGRGDMGANHACPPLPEIRGRRTRSPRCCWR